ncbi:MAG: hypothetical protein WKF58_13100 [Ilumatobacteraceae bacterium]
MTDESTEIGDAQAALDEARARLLEVPAEVVVTNHVMGLYELAAIHLSAAPPNIDAARLAIDAIAALVEGLGDRLGDGDSDDARRTCEHAHGVRRGHAHGRRDVSGEPDSSAAPRSARAARRLVVGARCRRPSR